MTVWQWPPSTHAVALQPAVKHAGALARLERGELAAAEALRPVRHQRGMGRAGHRVLVDPEIGDEHAAGDVVVGRRAR